LCTEHNLLLGEHNMAHRTYGHMVVLKGFMLRETPHGTQNTRLLPISKTHTLGEHHISRKYGSVFQLSVESY